MGNHMETVFIQGFRRVTIEEACSLVRLSFCWVSWAYFFLRRCAIYSTLMLEWHAVTKGLAARF